MIKWENPVLISLIPETEVRGTCSATGTGDSGDCVSTGVSAANDCAPGTSPGRQCLNGTGESPG